MTIEQTDKEIIIKIPSSTNIDEVQNLINFIRFREITSKSKASQKDVDKLVSKVKGKEAVKIRENRRLMPENENCTRYKYRFQRFNQP